MNKDIKIDKQLRIIRSLEKAATDIDVALKRAEALLEEYYVEDLLRQMVGEGAELTEEDLLDKVRTEEIINKIKGLKYENSNFTSVIRPADAQDENNAKIRLLEKIQDQKWLLKAKREDKKKKLKKDL